MTIINDLQAMIEDNDIQGIQWIIRDLERLNSVDYSRNMRILSDLANMIVISKNSKLFKELPRFTEIKKETVINAYLLCNIDIIEDLYYRFRIIPKDINLKIARFRGDLSILGFLDINGFRITEDLRP